VITACLVLPSFVRVLLMCPTEESEPCCATSACLSRSVLVLGGPHDLITRNGLAGFVDPPTAKLFVSDYFFTPMEGAVLDFFVQARPMITSLVKHKSLCSVSFEGSRLTFPYPLFRRAIQRYSLWGTSLPQDPVSCWVFYP